ncbi:hypothetical protein [Novosphingobium sp. PP1Y]|nr:hypothetical protein [Novosphingobium sp. PP1Y]
MNKQDDLLIEVDGNGELQLPKEIMARHGWGPGVPLVAGRSA